MIYASIIYFVLLVALSMHKRLPALFVFSIFGVFYWCLRPLLLEFDVYNKYAYLNDQYTNPNFEAVDYVALLVLLTGIIVSISYAVSMKFIIKKTKTKSFNPLSNERCWLYVVIIAIIYFSGLLPFYFPLMGVFLLMVILFVQKKDSKGFLKVCVVDCLAIFMILESEDRRDWLALIFIALFLYAFINKKISMLKFSISGGLGLLLIVYTSIALRTNGFNDVYAVIDRVQSDSSLVAIVEVETDFSIVYDDIPILIENINNDKLDYLYGETFFKPFVSFIPRELWEGKPETISRVFPKYVNYPFYEKGGSEPLTILGEAYWNFGVGCYVIFLFLGGYLAWIDSKFKKGLSEKNEQVIALAVVLSSTLFHILRGPADSFWLLHLFTFVILWLHNVTVLRKRS